MQRSPYKPVQLGHAVFQDRAPVSPSIYLSAAVLFLGYPLLAVLLGQATRDQAFVTAFMAALSVRIVQDFEPMLRRILTRNMLVCNLGLLLLNEVLIHTVTASNWLLFWAVLPLLCHTVLRALVQGVVTQSDSGQPV